MDTGNNVLTDARNTLRILQEFESRVSENQEAATMALDNVASIEEMIRNAEEKAGMARDAMTGADTSANLALTVALDAQNITNEASGKAANISAESSSALEQAEELSSSAESLADKLEQTKGQVRDKEGVAEQDSESARTV